MNKLKVGIAGYGVVGIRRRDAIDKHPSLTTVAACDVKFQQSGTFQDGMKCFNHYTDLLKEDLDILFVCLPNYLASEVTIAALKRGLHVFCEKPPGRDVNDIQQVVDVTKSFPELVLKYGFNHRYHESVREALRVLNSGELGRIINARGVYGKSKIIPFSGGWRAERRYSGGGILLDQGIHMVDLMRLFCGEFTQVHSYISNDFWHHDVEDNAYAMMRTDSGIIGMFHSTATEWRHRFRLELSLQSGSISLSGILSGTKSYGAETITIARKTEKDNGDPKETTIRYNEDNSWVEEVDEFASAVVNKTPISNGSAEEALKTMQLVYKIYCADDQWKSKWNLG